MLSTFPYSSTLSRACTGAPLLIIFPVEQESCPSAPVVGHCNRRPFAAVGIVLRVDLIGCRGLSADPQETSSRDDPDADRPDSEVAYIARSKRDIAEHFGVAWSTMQPRLVGKIGSKVTEMYDVLCVRTYMHYEEEEK